MSAPQFRAAETVAFQLVALLEMYEERVAKLSAIRFDPTLYAQVTRDIDSMRLYCASLPILSVPWVHLLISHTELVHSLFKCANAGKVLPQVEKCRAAHLSAVRSLREKCLYQFSRADSAH
ncbi:MAG: hypothetical protein JWP41_1391 [Ramlibacter sp.]|nr:hypothetical protein [Ramlibacter sp.]